MTNGTVSETHEPAHALLGASSAERWLVCTPSARLNELVEDEHSPYALEGTAAHAFAAVRLEYLLKQTTGAEYRAAYAETKASYLNVINDWDSSEWDAINAYTEYVMKEVERLGGDVYIEKKVDYSVYAQGGFGTSDVLIYAPDRKVIKSIDLKFGRGVAVSAADNPQAKLYALGGLLNLDTHHQIENIEWAIVQPRIEYIGEDETTTAELIKWAEDVVAPKAKLAWEGKGKLVTSEKGCRFCKVRASCRARVAENILIARRDFMEPIIDAEEHMLSMDDVSKILPLIDDWISWANSLKAFALKAVRDDGKKIEGFKLVRGRSNRAWKDGIDVAEELRAVGVSETDIFAEPAVRSVAQLEKTLGKRDYIEKVEPLVIKPLGTPTLVPESDSRPGVDAAAEALGAFAVTSKTENKETK